MGFDELIGLIPGIGDAATRALGLYIVYQAPRQSVPNTTLLRINYHLGVDAAFGAIPIAGDIFDVNYKCNVKNIRLLNEYLNSKNTNRKAGSA